MPAGGSRQRAPPCSANEPAPFECAQIAADRRAVCGEVGAEAGDLDEAFFLELLHDSGLTLSGMHAGSIYLSVLVYARFRLDMPQSGQLGSPRWFTGE